MSGCRLLYNRDKDRKLFSWCNTPRANPRQSRRLTDSSQGRECKTTVQSCLCCNTTCVNVIFSDKVDGHSDFRSYFCRKIISCMKKAAFLFVSAIMLFVSCEKNDDSISNGPGVATLETTDISCSSATFNGKIRVPNQIGTDFEFGFELSESESFDERTTTSYSVEIYSGNDMSYSFVLKYALKPEHRYYVRAYMYNIKSIY